MAQEIRFELNGVTYTQSAKGYCFKSTGTYDKKGNPIMMRIPRHIFEQTFEEYIKQANDEAEQAEWDAEMEARKQEQEQKDRETEAEFNKKAVKRTRKSKDIAHESNGVTITAKQADFIKHLPDTSFWENGLESTLWCDVLADEIGGQFAGKPMTVGAMISTLREKGIIVVGIERMNGKKAKYFAFTDIGRQVVKELGLK